MVFDHSDSSLIPVGETRTGHLLSNAHQGNITTSFFSDLFLRPIFSDGISGFSAGDKNINIFAGNQLALRGIDTDEKSWFLSAGTEIRVGIYEYFLPLIEINNLINHPTATMEIIPIHDQHYVFDISIGGINSNFIFEASSHPFNLGTPIGTVNEPSILLLMILGLGIFSFRNKIRS